MVCAGTAVLLHVQKFWIISAESNDLLALAQRFERPDGAKWALDRCFGRPDGAKLVLDRLFGRPDGAKLEFLFFLCFYPIFAQKRVKECSDPKVA